MNRRVLQRVGAVGAFVFAIAQLAHALLLIVWRDAGPDLAVLVLLEVEAAAVALLALGMAAAGAFVAAPLLLAAAVVSGVVRVPAMAWEVLTITFDWTDVGTLVHVAAVLALAASVAAGVAAIATMRGVGMRTAPAPGVFVALTVAPVVWLAIFAWVHVSPWRTGANREHAAEVFGVVRLLGIAGLGAVLWRASTSGRS